MIINDFFIIFNFKVLKTPIGSGVKKYAMGLPGD
jgi:hypothetical protein